MAISNITTPRSNLLMQQGARISSVTWTKDYKVHYGVQSATFTRTVFPGQATGTYRLNGMIPHWRGPQHTVGSIESGADNARVYSSHRVSGIVTSGTGRAAGSPPIPYPPHNATAYYSNPHTRIIPNAGFNAFG